MRWFGKAVPLISMGKKTVKQPVHVSILNCFESIYMLDLINIHVFAMKCL